MNANPPSSDAPVSRAVLLTLPKHASGRMAASCLTPLVDRPLVQHAIERLCGAGIRQIEVVGLAADARLRRFVCDEPRWGCRVTWRDANHGDDCEPLRRCAGEDRLVLADAHAVPLHSLHDPRLEEGVVAEIRAAGPSPWLGWSLLDGQVLDSLPASCGQAELHAWIEMLSEAHVVAQQVLRGATLDQLLASQRMLLEREAGRVGAGELGDAMVRLIGRETEPGVRLCRNVRVHRSAVLEGPLFIGDNTRIGRGVRLGPNSVVGPNCIIDHHAQIADSLVAESTYIGPWVEVRDCVARQHDITNVRLQARVSVDDPLVACGV